MFIDHVDDASGRRKGYANGWNGVLRRKKMALARNWVGYYYLSLSNSAGVWVTSKPGKQIREPIKQDAFSCLWNQRNGLEKRSEKQTNIPSKSYFRRFIFVNMTTYSFSDGSRK